MEYKDLYSYKDLSVLFNLSFADLYRRVNRLGIKGKRMGKEVGFTEQQIKDIVVFRRKNEYKNHRRKLTIIEMYQKLGSASAVSRTLNINKKSVLSAVNEYLKDGTVTVDSKINNERSTSDKRRR